MRIAVALLLLAVFIVITARLVPPYFHDREFKAYIDDVASSPQSATLPVEMLRVRVIDRARQLGIPLRGDQVRVAREASVLKIDIRYVVPVDIYVSTVDLHFHARAGTR